MNTLPIVLTIAGTDPSGGAGIQADIKTISATGSYAASVITAIVAQNTQGVDAIYELDSLCINSQIESVFNDLKVSAVKIGMLHNRKIIEVVAATLKKFSFQNVVLDPVMYAKSNDPLIGFADIEILKEQLLPFVDLITPNIPECEHLLGVKINDLPTMEKAARELSETYNINVLLKGGHLNNEQSPDLLYEINRACKWFETKRIKSKNTHGTGCTLSSAIASYLAQGLLLNEAVAEAKNYLTEALKAACFLKIGKGNGPLDHFYNYRK